MIREYIIEQGGEGASYTEDKLQNTRSQFTKEAQRRDKPRMKWKGKKQNNQDDKRHNEKGIISTKE